MQLSIKKTATIQDVAKHAGVSTATVSRTLSNPEIVTEDTRNLVMEAVRATGYRANRAARNLRTQKAGAVGVLVPNLSNPFFSGILAGIQSVFGKTDYSVLITDTLMDAGERHPGEWMLLDGRVDGLLVLDSGQTNASQAILANAPPEAPVVFGNELDLRGKFPGVGCDDVRGGEMAAEHLCGLGHERLVIFTGEKGNPVSEQREAGFCAKAKSLGATRVEVMHGDFTTQSAEKMVPELLAMSPRPTGVFCCSDMMALAVLSGALRAGLRVPEDMSVIGYDDLTVSQYFVPALTTIRQDRQMIGAGSAKMLLDLLEKKVPMGAAQDVVVPLELIERASTAAYQG
ncbi:LacI family DNA-binding transcriptional regulator [Alphaproteobacteria bacterium KMM 3653]|uniref:LacI family DNA-binding transcriptional regulator n=1 Tax=Harenicola maris TaxID=2841044 RepID=A0AAP2CPG3_9RHOB|nr:LacI family DNA-binding transcriptional regulator [Harenicola maris]